MNRAFSRPSSTPSGVSPRERQGFDVADGSADLDHRHVRPATAEPDAALDLVRDVRNDLNCAAQVVAWRSLRITFS